MDFEERLEGRGALLGLPFLKPSQRGVQEKNGKDKRCIGALTNDQRDRRGYEEDINQRAQKLTQENRENRRGRLDRQTIRTEGALPIPNLGRA